MTVEQLTTAVETQFREISAALFNGNIRFQEIAATDHVFAEASPMFGENILRYSPTNFRYFYRLEKYLCNVVDLVNVRVIEKGFPKLAVTDTILNLSATEQIAAYEDKDVPSHAQFVEHIFILNLFVFLHECGHLTQVVSEVEEGPATNHFGEFNADYFALTKILQYYNTMKTARPAAYVSRVRTFGSEQHFIRLTIVKALTVTYFGVLPNLDSMDTETHPAIRKRFCYLLVQSVQQLNANFQSLFVSDTLHDFLVDIFKTMHFLENFVFETAERLFDNLTVCLSDFKEIDEHLKSGSNFQSLNP